MIGNQHIEPRTRVRKPRNLGGARSKRACRLDMEYAMAERIAAAKACGRRLRGDPSLGEGRALTLYGLAAASREAIRFLAERGIGAVRIKSTSQHGGLLTVEIAHFPALDALPGAEAVESARSGQFPPGPTVHGILVNPICLLLWECPTAPEAGHA